MTTQNLPTRGPGCSHGYTAFRGKHPNGKPCTDETPYTEADIRCATRSVAATLGVDPFADSRVVAVRVLDALVAAGWQARPLDANGNRPDHCGHCTLVPTVNGWVRGKQSTCPVHGDPRSALDKLTTTEETPDA